MKSVIHFLIATFICVTPAVADTPIKWWPVGSVDDPMFGAGIVVDASGTVYVADAVSMLIFVYDANGQYQTRWTQRGDAPGEMSMAGYPHIAPNGNLLVPDWNRVQEFTTSGTFLREIGPNIDSLPFNASIAATTSPGGDIYIVDAHNQRIVHTSSTGELIRTWGSEGTGDGQFLEPVEICMDQAGFIYIADFRGNRIQKFDDQGQFILAWGAAGSGPGQFSGPTSLACSTNNLIYVLDHYNNRVQVFDQSGNYLKSWGGTGSGLGQFQRPNGIAIDGSGLIYVTDSGNFRVQVFEPDNVPTLPTTWSSLKTRFESR